MKLWNGAMLRHKAVFHGGADGGAGGRADGSADGGAENR